MLNAYCYLVVKKGLPKQREIMNEEERKLIIKLDRMKRRLAMAKGYLGLTQGQLFEEATNTVDRLTKQYAKLGGDSKLDELLNKRYPLTVKGEN